MGQEPLKCKTCGAPFSDMAIDSAMQFEGAMLIKCDHCYTNSGYTPSNSSYSVINDVGAQQIAEQLRLLRLFEIEREERRIKEDAEAKKEAIFAELRALVAPPPEEVYIKRRR